MIVFISLIVMILIFFRMNTNVKKGKINFKYVYTSYVVLGFFFASGIAFMLFTERINHLVAKLGIGEPSTLFLLIMVAYLFYVSFLEQIQIGRQQEKIEELTSILSIYIKEHDENNNN